MGGLRRFFGNGERLMLAFALLAMLTLSALGGESPGQRYVMTSAKTFDEVLEDLEFAITEHNFRITGRNDVGDAIAKRDHPDFPRASIVHFCNIEYAREFLEVSFDYFIRMPCRVVLYERDGGVVVEAQLLPEDDAKMRDLSERMNRLLKTIVAYAAT